MSTIERREDLERKGFFLVLDYEARRDSTAYVGYRCPVCRGVHPDSPGMNGDGHKPGCWLAEALSANEGIPRGPMTVGQVLRAMIAFVEVPYDGHLTRNAVMQLTFDGEQFYALDTIEDTGEGGVVGQLVPFS